MDLVDRLIRIRSVDTLILTLLLLVDQDSQRRSIRRRKQVSFRIRSVGRWIRILLLVERGSWRTTILHRRRVSFQRVRRVVVSFLECREAFSGLRTDSLRQHYEQHGILSYAYVG